MIHHTIIASLILLHPFFVTNTLLAQTSPPVALAYPTATSAPGKNTMQGAEIHVHPGSLKAFANKYGSVDNLKWVNDEGRSTAYFNIKDKQVRACFSKNGKFQYSITYYSSPVNLPKNLLSLIKKSYPSRSIYGVTELTGRDNTAYRILLKNSNSLLTIQYLNNGITELTKMNSSAE